jgi:hypothetical protein
MAAGTVSPGYKLERAGTKYVGIDVHPRSFDSAVVGERAWPIYVQPISAKCSGHFKVATLGEIEGGDAFEIGLGVEGVRPGIIDRRELVTAAVGDLSEIERLAAGETDSSVAAPVKSVR